METDKDHIHYMIETEPAMSVSKIVNPMKSYMAYHIYSAYKKFFKEHAGYPQFKSKHDNCKSHTTSFTNENISVDFETGKIKLPKLKHVRAKLHRKFTGQIKSSTVSQVPSGKFSSFFVKILKKG